MKSYKILVIFLFLFQVGSLIAQPMKSFSGTGEVFLKDLESFMEAADKKATNDLLDVFEPIWLTKLNSAQQQTVVTVANAMLKKRMTAFPNFKNYIRCLIAWDEGKKSVQQFNDWHSTLEKTVTKLTSGKYDQYLQISEDLFRENALYKSEAITWYMGRGDFVFSYDSIPS